ncbi:MAG: ABC transporter ATP-binding protein [Muribaculaceae bacterium]|nr:ABC transporter ATP-binding protein [Muribaculaceae bacterium]
MITLTNLTYSYHRGVVAINDASAVVSPGIHLLLGENGAGKTTLLRIIGGLLIPQNGSCSIDGEDVKLRLPSTLQRTFFLPDTVELPAKSVNAFAAIHSRFYPNFSRDTLEANLREFGLTGDEEFSKLSLGMRHKAIVAYAISLHVDVLLLDEPANGLDITSKKSLRSMLARNTGEEQTVIISTHTVSDLKELYDGLIVLSKGKLLICRPSWEISERLACIDTTIPPAQRIFMEQGLGIFHSLIINEDGLTTDLNYHLLYSALMSPERDRILEIINR